jgi:hypothetical protein
MVPEAAWHGTSQAARLGADLMPSTAPVCIRFRVSALMLLPACCDASRPCQFQRNFLYLRTHAATWLWRGMPLPLMLPLSLSFSHGTLLHSDDSGPLFSSFRQTCKIDVHASCLKGCAVVSTGLQLLHPALENTYEHYMLVHGAARAPHMRN